MERIGARLIGVCSCLPVSEAGSQIEAVVVVVRVVVVMVELWYIGILRALI